MLNMKYLCGVAAKNFNLILYLDMIAAVKYLKNYLVKEGIEEFQEGKFRAPMEWALSVGASSAFINGNS